MRASSIPTAADDFIDGGVENVPVSNLESPTQYGRLSKRTSIPNATADRNAEKELDALIVSLNERRHNASGQSTTLQLDRVQALRDLTLKALIPVFVELAEKYAESSITMQMDASSFLQGGRELKFEFCLGEYRSELLGTVTADAIAFHETRYSPDVHGELVSGPMLRLRNLTGDTFRNFVCDRVATLVRAAMRHH